MLVGQYHMVAFFLNSAGTRLEPGFETETLPEPTGADADAADGAHRDA
ncbi:hypothetical protein ACFWIO_32330 [Streptomyces diastatochromogenes]